MEGLCHPMSRTINRINLQIPKLRTLQRIPSVNGRGLQCHGSKYEEALPEKDEFVKHSKKSLKLQPKARRLITISTSDCKYQGQWTYDFVFTLRELQLDDLAEEGQGDAEHTGFGYSIDGKVTSSFTRKCSNCFCKYIKEIDTTFNVWVLPSKESHSMPEIGGDDPSVIYVKPGTEADLDSLIQDTIRLYTSVKGTCSDACDKLGPKLQYIGPKEKPFDKRWSRLLEIKRAMTREIYPSIYSLTKQCNEDYVQQQ
ncbi:hypothetical protein EJ110_NYTH07634 [Nymphaea thermarum]|nr:hypothetical protein EJ110_NYTH07634 [Nymphaea thermarum]